MSAYTELVTRIMNARALYIEQTGATPNEIRLSDEQCDILAKSSHIRYLYHPPSGCAALTFMGMRVNLTTED